MHTAKQPACMASQSEKDCKMLTGETQTFRRKLPKQMLFTFLFSITYQKIIKIPVGKVFLRKTQREVVET